MARLRLDERIDPFLRAFGKLEDLRRVGALRLRLLKVGGRVWQWRDRVRLRLAASHPGQPLWDHLAAYQRRE